MRADRRDHLLLDALDRIDRLEGQMAEYLASGGDQSGEEFLTPAQAAETACCHVETIRRAIRRGDLTAQHVGGALRISRGALEAWMNAGRPERRASTARPRRARPSTRRPLAEALAELDAGAA